MWLWFERRLCRRSLRIARLVRTGPTPWPSCGSHCVLGGRLRVSFPRFYQLVISPGTACAFQPLRRPRTPCFPAEIADPGPPRQETVSNARGLEPARARGRAPAPVEAPCPRRVGPLDADDPDPGLRLVDHLAESLSKLRRPPDPIPHPPAGRAVSITAGCGASGPTGGANEVRAAAASGSSDDKLLEALRRAGGIRVLEAARLVVVDRLDPERIVVGAERLVDRRPPLPLRAEAGRARTESPFPGYWFDAAG